MWTQVYDPFGNWPLSTLMAALPVLVLLGLLASGKMGAWQAALCGLGTASAVAATVFRMPPAMILASVGVGVSFALFRIVWLIVAAVFLYDIAVATGQFDIMKASIARLSGDRRIQAVLVAFSFGAFIEGAAGFGAPVAISAAFLVGLGFQPFQAAMLCLIANTAPVAWGAIGTPILTLSKVTELDVEALSATAGRILPFLSLIIPFWLVRTMTGWRQTFAVWPALLVIGGTFAGIQFAWSNFVGFELVDLVSAVGSLVAGVVLLQFWRPRDEWRFAHEEESDKDKAGRPLDPTHPPLTAGRVARAWMPFALLSLTVLVWGIPAVKPLGTPAVKDWLDTHTSWKPAMPGLHEQVAKGEAVTGHSRPEPKDYEKATLDLVPVSSTGTAVFLAAILSGLLLGVGPASMAMTLAQTVARMVPAIAAIFSMLALGFVTKYSGMDAVLGLAFTRTGPWLYPVFGTMLGWLGVALTGSDTSSNVLFGNLQKITAKKLGLNPILMAAANTTGGVMGKMIDAQSIVVAAAATGEGGREGELLRAVLWHSVALALIVGVIVWIYAHVTPWMVAMPHLPSH
ncbi:lactate permease [Singulisphaera sp. GP187]|uniref:L-lactate permease n=1 Tax=Singulisphaera sp. GP187 TaxID=1882752 RepID=UPI00092B66E1|nr:L-lactate permease [Singulisphaera sp. GP187]SIO58950.1 lactate permease [Singulisphaera sp. GP187]